MDERIKKIAEQMGAKIVAELPDVGHGAMGAAHYAAFYRKRMEAIRLDSETVKDIVAPLPVPLDQATVEALETISEIVWPESKISVANLAAGFLKGMSVLILDQLIKQLEAEQKEAKKTLDAKAALIAALQEIVTPPAARQSAG